MPYVSCAKLDAEISALEDQLDGKQGQLKDPSGADIAAGACVITCPATTGSDGQVLTVQPDGTFAWETPMTSSGGLAVVTHDATLSGSGTTASPLSVVQATDAQRGAVELATAAEATAGTSTTLAVTPAGLKAALDTALDNAFVDKDGTAISSGSCLLTCPSNPGAVGQVLTIQSDGTLGWSTPSSGGGGGGLTTVSHDATLSGDGTSGSPLSVVSATDAVKGVVELATAAEAAAGTSTTLAVTPAGLAAAVPAASDAVAGKVELATAAETTAGTSTTLAVTPAGVTAAISGAFTDCNGAAIAKGATIATCANLTAAVPSGGTDGQVLTKQADGTNAWETPASSATGNFTNLNQQVFEANGNFTVPAGITKLRVTLIGGGGGGGLGSALDTDGDGNSDLFFKPKPGEPGMGTVLVTVTPGQVIPVTIGCGGAGAVQPSNISGSGGTTSFGTYATATGGGGTLASVTVSPANGTFSVGAGAVNYWGGPNIRGQNGVDDPLGASTPTGGSAGMSGGGGIPQKPGGAASLYGGTAGSAGTLTAGGAGGGSCGGAGGSGAGGGGGTGGVIVEW